MDEREVAIVAQVAAKEAGEMVRSSGGSFRPNDDTFAIFDGWYQHIAQKIVGSVRLAFPTSPQAAPNAPTAAPYTPPMPNVPAVPQGPSCPQHGLMIPGPGQTKGKGPLWKCNESKWDFNTKQEVGCTYVIWPEREAS